MKYSGSCHCGRIAFEVEGTIERATQCNCSICSKRGYLLWVGPRDSMKLLSPEENLSTYTFNQHRVKHRFCATCGVAPFGEGADGKGRSTVAVNVRCLEGIDPAALQIDHFDGKSL